MRPETDIDLPDLVAVTLFHDRILLLTAPTLPLAKVRPVIRRDGRCHRLEVRDTVRLAPPERGVCLEAAYAGHAAAGARLQVWVEGYLLHDRALPDATGRLTGGLDGVADYRLTGWVADLFGARLPDGVLLVDGVEIGPIAAPVLRHRHNRYAPLQSCAGFGVDLPSFCVDQASHTLAARFGGLTLGPVAFQARPLAHIERATPARLGLWFSDPALRDETVTISVLGPGGAVLARGGTVSRDDVQAEIGRLCTGFSTHLPDRLPQGPIEVRAGAAAQHLLATLQSSDLLSCVTEMREVAELLRRIETRIGRPLAWSRSAIRSLRDESQLVALFAPGLHAAVPQRPTPICVIVPVYRGVAETQACLRSLRAASLAGSSGIGRVLVIADAPPEPDMLPMLRAVAGAWGDVTAELLENGDNLGFVATVNRGLAAAGPDSDVILLNADTIVPEGFAARLQRAAYAREGIASVTPLSNDATIASLPHRGGGNRIDPGMVATLDRHLHGQQAVEIPVGVGFCLFIKAEARRDVGGFSEEWQRGYCEEADWCLRAADLGWSHVAAADVFVFHHGAVSFGVGERDGLLRRNHAVLERRYPEFLPMVRAFLTRDPLWRVRLGAFILLLTQVPRRTVAHFSHALGGGTAVLVEAAAEQLAREDHHNLICTLPKDEFTGATVLQVTWRESAVSLVLPPSALADLMAALVGAVPGLRVVVHSLTGVGAEIHRLALAHAVPLAVYIHDFQWYCPRVVLVDHTRRYCGEPELRYCQLCARVGPIYDFGDDETLIRSDIGAWIARNGDLLRAARTVVVPSRDTRMRLSRRFGLPNLTVLPHPEATPVGGITRAQDDDPITRVAVVGGISVQKGLDVVRDLGGFIDASGAALRIRVIGEVEDPALLDGLMSVEVMGRYARDDLRHLLRRFDPHFVFFPAVWPETYSFTLSEVWAAGYPAVSFDIGAIAERIRRSGAGVVLPFEPDAGILLPRLLLARDDVAKLRGLEVVIGQALEQLGSVLFG